uniref:Uncharacterized protein n=1 Tax=Anguilla anguilla TaxID=7936 RepID=A0A0E9PCN2_ANGAN
MDWNMCLTPFAGPQQQQRASLTNVNVCD